MKYISEPLQSSSNTHFCLLPTNTHFLLIRHVNEERFLFSAINCTSVQVVRSAINPPPASADENVLMSRSDRLTKFCIFNVSLTEFEIGIKRLSQHTLTTFQWQRGSFAGFILLDIGAILSWAKMVYSANVVFTNVRATKYVTCTYIPLDIRVSWASTIRRLTHLLIYCTDACNMYVWNFVSFVTDVKQIWHKEDYHLLICNIL